MHPQLSQLLLFTAKAVFVNLEEGIMVGQIASGSTLGRIAFWTLGADAGFGWNLVARLWSPVEIV